MVKNCLMCRKIFTTIPCLLKRGRGKFCSRQCSCSYRSLNSGILKYCLLCGKKYKCSPSKNQTRKYCSKVCYHKARVGLHLSEETKRKIGKANAIALKGKKPAQWILDKSIAANKGKKRSLEIRTNISIAKKDKPLSKEHKANVIKNFSPEWLFHMNKDHAGKNCHFWKGGVSPVNKKIKASKEHKSWRELVFQRDNWSCQVCGIRGSKLHPHHIKSFSEFPELRFETSNGITLCHSCHHKTDSYGVNTHCSTNKEENGKSV